MTGAAHQDDAERLLDPVRGFLDAPRCAVLATTTADGAPRQVVIHYTLELDHLVLNGRSDRGWARRLRHDPRAHVIVHDPDDYLHYVSIHGRARVSAEGEPALTHAMRQAARHGEDPEGFAGQSRVSFRLEPEHVYEYR